MNCIGVPVRFKSRAKWYEVVQSHLMKRCKAVFRDVLPILSQDDIIKAMQGDAGH